MPSHNIYDNQKKKNKYQLSPECQHYNNEQEWNQGVNSKYLKQKNIKLLKIIKKNNNTYNNSKNSSSRRQSSSNIINKNNSKKSINHNRSSTSPSLSLIEINQSLNQIRNKRIQEEQRSIKISNKLKYLLTSTQRKQKLALSAKRKFNYINSVREKSFTQKNILNKEKLKLQKQIQQITNLKASKVKNQKIQAIKSQKNLIENNKKQAQNLRKQKLINQSIVKQIQKQEIILHQKQARKIQKQAQIQKQRSQSRSKERILSGKLNHKKIIVEEYYKCQKQIKLNERLLNKFKTSAMQIYDKKIETQQELFLYRNYLGLNKNQNNLSDQQPKLYNSTTTKDNNNVMRQKFYDKKKQNMYKNIKLNISINRSTNFSPQLKNLHPNTYQTRLNQSMKLKSSFNQKDLDLYLTNPQ